MNLKSTLIHNWHEMAYESRGPLRALFFLWWPFMWIYSFAAKTRRRLYLRGWIQPKRLAVPVISVGNITVGGVGKTPFVMFVGQWLKEKGWRPAVVIRGYHRKSKEPFILDNTNFESNDVYAYGDEPVLIMKTLGIPVGVGSDRYEIGKKLLRKEKCNVILLDDGFQHYQLHRDCDFVILDGDNPLGSGHCLPYGPLREPSAVLHYADALIFRGERRSSKHDFNHYDKPMFEGEMEWKDIVPLNEWFENTINNAIGLDDMKGREIDVMCGIGTPQRFMKQAEKHEIGVRHRWIHSDHYWYTKEDVDRTHDSDFCLITEKDAVRFYPLMDDVKLNHFYVVRAAWRMKQEQVFFDWLTTSLTK